MLILMTLSGQVRLTQNWCCPENGEAMEIIGEAVKLSNVKVVGLHCHIGSQIFELAPFEEAARVMLTFIAKIKEELGIELRS